LKIYGSEELKSLTQNSEGSCASLTQNYEYEIKLLKSSKYISKTKVRRIK